MTTQTQVQRPTREFALRSIRPPGNGLLGLDLGHSRQPRRDHGQQGCPFVLGASAARLDVDKPLTALGLDSLMAVELQIRIRGDLGVEIPVMNLLQRQGITDLAGYVVTR